MIRPSSLPLLAAAKHGGRPVATGVVAPRVAGRMNKTEAAYADLLRQRQIAGDVAWYRYECITLRIGDDCTYRPDFLVMLSDGALELHETKGFMRDDALVKIRAVAEQYPFRFKLCRLLKGKWEITEL